VNLPIAAGAGLVIGLIHFFGEELDEHTPEYNSFVSFSAGFTLAYFFLILLPETMGNSILNIQNIPVLAGIGVFYVLEEVLYEREENFGTIRSELKEIHSLFIGLYYLIIGMLLSFLSTKPGSFTLFFLPVLLHTAVNSLAIKEMHEEMVENLYVKLIVSGSTLLGVLIGALSNLSPAVLYSLLGLMGGSFIYLVMHDAMDPKRERPIGFVAGASVFLLMIHLIL